MSVCNPDTWEAKVRKTAVSLQLTWPTQQAPSQLVLQSWTLSQHGKGERKEEKIGWIFLKRRDVNCIPTCIEEPERLGSLNALCVKEFRIQAPVLVCLSAAVINTMAKSNVWRKEFIWLTHHPSPSLREVQNCKGKLSTRLLSHIV